MRVIRTLADSTTTMPKTKRLTVRELRNSGLPTNLKLATCAAISEGTPRVQLLVGMNLLPLAALAHLSGVSGILCSSFPPTADRASIVDRLLRFCCASISGVRYTIYGEVDNDARARCVKTLLYCVSSVQPGLTSPHDSM